MNFEFQIVAHFLCFIYLFMMRLIILDGSMGEELIKRGVKGSAGKAFMGACLCTKLSVNSITDSSVKS